MNKNTGVENLAQEFAALPQALESLQLTGGSSSVILARLVPGLTCNTWRKACAGQPLSQWHALPLAQDGLQDEDGSQIPQIADDALPISPFRDVAGVLTRAAFLRLLDRELVRLGRHGGNMSVVGASIFNRKATVTALGAGTVARLEAILGQTLLGRLETCDAIGILKNGVFMCSLPGLGQLAARRFAETAKEAFMEAARPFFPCGGISAGQLGGCAMGIVNIMPGDISTPLELLKRARATLDIAMQKEGGHIHQETATAPLDAATLVQSSEKRFLFFGGEPK